MKSLKTLRLLNLLLGLSATALLAQTTSTTPPAGDPPSDRGSHVDPLFALFDANGDGVLSATEIANAPTVLQTVAKATDGTLTLDDLYPAPEAPSDATKPADAPADAVKPADAPARPVPPLFAALDTDGDGVLSATEIANAATSLKTLDKNSDGQITFDEIRPTPPADSSSDSASSSNSGGPGGGQRPLPPSHG